MKKVNALGLCRILRTHLAFSSEHAGVLQDRPFYPTRDITIDQLLEGVIAGNGVLHLDAEHPNSPHDRNDSKP